MKSERKQRHFDIHLLPKLNDEIVSERIHLLVFLLVNCDTFMCHPMKLGDIFGNHIQFSHERYHDAYQTGAGELGQLKENWLLA